MSEISLHKMIKPISVLNIATNSLLTLLSVAYPLLWLWQPNHESLGWFPFALSVLWLIKGIQAVDFHRFFALGMAVLLGIVGISKGMDLMYWYPIIINLFMLSLFGGSLWTTQSMIERFARLQDPNLPEQAVAYTRKVTQVWCVVFVLNIIITTSFILLKEYELWAIYSGIIAYVIMAVVLIGEWLIRPKH